MERLDADIVLVSAGRILVNKRFMTNVNGVYAIGDATFVVLFVRNYELRHLLWNIVITLLKSHVSLHFPPTSLQGRAGIIRDPVRNFKLGPIS